MSQVAYINPKFSRLPLSAMTVAPATRDRNDDHRYSIPIGSHPEPVLPPPMVDNQACYYTFPRHPSDPKMKCQLPNLNTVLSRIQVQQRLPLPQPSFPSEYSRISPNGPIVPVSTNTATARSTPIMGPMNTMGYKPLGTPGSSSSSSISSPSIQSKLEVLSPIVLPTVQATVEQRKANAAILGRRSRKSSLNRKYQCAMCGKFFTTSGHLARHNRIHTGIKNHVCPFKGCNARFSRQDNCMQHYKTHLNGKKSRKRSKFPEL